MRSQLDKYDDPTKLVLHQRIADELAPELAIYFKDYIESVLEAFARLRTLNADLEKENKFLKDQLSATLSMEKTNDK